jgi:phosphoribosyl 1,2-cyclic phosphate phosphodiesterase
MQDEVIPVYAHPDTMADVRRIFNYVGTEAPHGVYRPMAEFVELGEAEQKVGDLGITPFLVEHDQKPTLGFIFRHHGGSVAYAPDCRGIEKGALEALRGIDVMILDGLRHRPHRTHFTVEESVKTLNAIGAKRSYLTHISHELDHGPTEAELPDSVQLAYDRLDVDIDADV